MNAVLLINLSAYILLLLVGICAVVLVVKKTVNYIETIIERGVKVFETTTQKGVDTCETFIEKYVPSDNFVTIKITKEYLEDLAEECEFEVKDYSKLLDCIRRNIWKKIGVECVSPMETAICDVLTIAEEQNIVVNILEKELSKEFNRSQDDDIKEKAVKRLKNEDLLERKELNFFTKHKLKKSNLSYTSSPNEV